MTFNKYFPCVLCTIFIQKLNKFLMCNNCLKKRQVFKIVISHLYKKVADQGYTGIEKRKFFKHSSQFQDANGLDLSYIVSGIYRYTLENTKIGKRYIKLEEDK